ncbi:MAG: hypothetical protein CM1200mP16_09080 [Nitrospina sp.]|nr:MAG: hypothetical protein CM1200mP16_09080 [Nitrospina sp.]
MSISGPGWNSDTHLYELFKNGFKFNPDLVILAYYHNDIPFPISVNCNSSERKVFTNINIFRSYKLSSFIDFRINRLLEKFGDKPSYPDCLNQVYDSIGWQMNKFYLDIMGLALSVQKIHFMITVIPLIHKLDNSYPLLGPHEKLKEFAQQRNLEFLDFYEEGFKNLDANNLKISKTDHHLNHNAGDIVASTLFSKLKSLTNYKKLSYFNKAFTLKEILNEDSSLIKLDSLLNKQNSINSFIINSETETLQVTKDSNQFLIKKTQKGRNGRDPNFSLETKLSLSGDYISQEQISFHPKSTTPKLKEKIYKDSEAYTQTFERIETDSNGKQITTQFRQRKFQFGIEVIKNYKKLNLEAGIDFPDPKWLDKWVFQDIQPPSIHSSIAKQKEVIISMIIQNPNTYNTPHDINIAKHPEYLDQLSNDDISQIFDEMVLFETFLVLERYRANDYLNLLIRLIEKSKPSLIALNAAERYRNSLLAPSSG